MTYDTVCRIVRCPWALAVCLVATWTLVVPARAQTCIPQYSCSLCSSDLPALCKTIPGAGACCGAEGHVSHRTSIEFEFGAEVCGIHDSLHITKEVETGHSYMSLPCRCCQLQACYRHAHFEARTCTRTVVDQWACNGDYDGCTWGMLTCEPSHCHIEVYTVVSFVTGEPVVTPDCSEDASCFCQQRGFSCQCPPQPPAPPAPPSEHGDGIISPNGSNNLNFNVGQLANKGTSVDPGALDSWGSLSMAQLADLRDMIEEAVDYFQYDRTDTEICLKFVGGAADLRSYANWASTLAATKAQKLATNSAYDVDGNGTVDFDDLFLAAVERQAADRHWVWLSRADVDGDSAMTGKDLCLIHQAIMGE